MKLDFKPITREDIATLRPLLTAHPFRSCDFTVGGVFLWAGYFQYSWCVVENTLFIKGFPVNGGSTPAFSLPLGAMPLDESLGLIRDHCKAEGIGMELSSVPEEALPLLIDEGAVHIEGLNDWLTMSMTLRLLPLSQGRNLPRSAIMPTALRLTIRMPNFMP